MWNFVAAWILKLVYAVSDGENSMTEWQGYNFYLKLLWFSQQGSSGV